MDIRNYSFKGYQNYEPTRLSIETLLLEVFGEENMPFQIAVNEAVLNAAKYSIHGLQKADVCITVRIMPSELRVTVQSETVPFDAAKHKRMLQTLLEDESTASLDWGDYVGDTDAGRGLWFILTAVDYLYMDEKGQEITLVARIPKSNLPEVQKLYFLVPKFFVMRNGVVI